MGLSDQRADDLERIGQALGRARAVLAGFTPGAVAHRVKHGDDPVTEADLQVNRVLLETLPRHGEGWLSEETADDRTRLGAERVWIVDPLDGTREFVAGIPEWCVSIGLVENGRPVAGGVLNPATGQSILGSTEGGLLLDGAPCSPRQPEQLEGATVLASRSECKRGEWDRFRDAPFAVRPMGSVAYKLALVAAGLADATWTLVPKNEWDVAAGAALVLAAGGRVWLPGGAAPTFNRSDPLLPGLIAAPGGLAGAVEAYLAAAGASG